MARWIFSFGVVLVLICILYYVIRLRRIPEGETKERRHAAAEHRKRWRRRR